MAKFFKKDDETFLEYKQRVVDDISPSFCAAKWYNATISLHEGTTSSCHHPKSHIIPKNELINNPSALHNTNFKKEKRKEMLNGVRPKECEYCWKIEDNHINNISDRVYKTSIYEEKEIKKIIDVYGWNKNSILKTLEISFDSNCNFACSYCNPTFSTLWQSDIIKNGVYEITNEYDNNTKFKFGNSTIDDEYINAFWLWWDSELKNTLTELRITGGEPTLSKHFWNLIDWWKINQPKIDFAVNSNLGQNTKITNKLIDATHYFDHFTLYTSNESFGKHSEYIRDGLNWNLWWNNLNDFFKNGKTFGISMMMTINALSLFSLLEFMNKMMELKNKYNRISPGCSFNILRHPNFQSVLVLDSDIRFKIADEIENWVEKNWCGGKNYFMEWEKNDMLRLSNYLKENDLENKYGINISECRTNFKNFYTQYDIRRNKNFIETFPMISHMMQ